ncbi:MAG: YbaK/EbsC family protein [candidate division NC10 bacterium]|nr:YbaK/EbsC family protein [candidate division NC10 bacterium]
MTTPSLLGEADVARVIGERGIAAEIVHPGEKTPTVEAAAVALHVGTAQIVKSLVFLVDDVPHLVITNGTGRVDARALAVALGARKARLARPEEASALTGYAVGGMPPFGHRHPLPVLLEARVLEQPVVYAGAGSNGAMLRVRPRELLRATGARLVSLATPNPGGGGR